MTPRSTADRRPPAVHPVGFDEPTHGYVARIDLPISRARAALRTALRPHCATETELRQQLSPMEVELLAAMWFYGLEPELQVQLGPYRVDFYFPKQHVAVEVDGREWHKSGRDWRRDGHLRDRHDVIVRRYIGSQVFRDPLFCARDVQRIVEWIDARLDRVKTQPLEKGAG